MDPTSIPPLPTVTSVVATVDERNSNVAVAYGTPNHPTYKEVRLNTLDKRAIAKYIDQTFTHLPSTHSALLTLHLKRLKSKGVLVMVKKSYKFARFYASSHSTQPKRGRPRKPKPNLEQPQLLEARNNAKRMLVRGLPVTVPVMPIAPPRGRGRPKKINAATMSHLGDAPQAVGGGCGRGRGISPGSIALFIFLNEEKATSDSDDLKRKLRYFQSKVRESLVPMKGIIQELETLASMDLN
ncbi:histone H1-like [Senna tora]|uniref:Histone H1-like n=1 Tax=Senna tora TaxID=362788 RepID=A0A834WYY3_9FABA|nr:histone H1-like [Senna tora]